MQSNENSERAISQWVTSIENSQTKSAEHQIYLNSILGPLKADKGEYVKLESDSEGALQNSNDLHANNFYQTNLKGWQSRPIDESANFRHEVVFKIKDKCFIDGINLYLKACDLSALLKIEAKEVKENKGKC